jgi:hypothetical protein
VDVIRVSRTPAGGRSEETARTFKPDDASRSLGESFVRPAPAFERVYTSQTQACELPGLVPPSSESDQLRRGSNDAMGASG